MLDLQPRSVDDAVQNLLGRGDALQAGSTPANPTAANTSWESLWGATPSWVTSGGEVAFAACTCEASAPQHSSCQ